MQNTIGGARWKAPQLVVELPRTEQGEHHKLVEIRAAAFDADLSSYGGMAAVAADHVVSFQDFSSGAVLDNGNARATLVLFDFFSGPAEPALDVVKLRHSFAQDMFGLVLGQSFIFLEVIGIDDLAKRRCVPVFIVEVAVRDNSTHGVIGRQHARRSHRVGNAPKIEVLHRALRQVLPFRNALRFDAAFDKGAGYSAKPKLDCERVAHRPAADNDDLMPLAHPLIYFLRLVIRYCRTKRTGSGLSGTRCQVLMSFSSKRQVCPRAERSTNSPLSICQDVGPKRVIRASQPGLTFSTRLSAPAAAFARVSMQIGLPVPRAIAQSPTMSSAERTCTAAAACRM